MWFWHWESHKKIYLYISMKYFIPSTSKTYSLRHLILSLISRKERNLDLCSFFILTTPDNLLNRFTLGSFYFSLLNQQKSMENKAYPSCVKHMHPVLYMANSYLLCSSMVFLYLTQDFITYITWTFLYF